MPLPLDGPGPSAETAIAIALLSRGQDEITRQVADMRSENNRQFADLRTELGRTFALKSDLTTLDVETKTLRRDVDKHGDQIGWVVKTIVGAFLLAVVGLLLAKGGVPRL